MNNIGKFLEPFSYKKEFKDLMVRLEDKYGRNIFNLCGIGEQLDISKMSKKFFKSKATADASVDGNANVSDKSIISHKIETAKPLQLINSFYRVWKDLKKSRNKEYAEKIIESQINGRIYINDFVGISSAQPYSYYGKTILVVKYRETILYLNMEELFEMFTNKIEYLEDRETINLTNVNIEVLDENNKFVKMTKVLRHKSHCGLIKLETKNGYTTVVTEDHPVILEDNSEKNGADIKIGDRLKISDSYINTFDSKEGEINRLKYIVGFGIGDGYLTGGTEHSYQLGIVQKNIREHKIFDYVSKEFDNISIRDKSKNCETQNMVFGNKCFICRECDIKKGTENKTLPKDILNWNRNEILSLIAGLIDADGCVNGSSGVIDIRLASFSVIQQVAEILRWLGMDNVRTSLMKDYQRGNSFIQKLDMYRVSFVTKDEVFISYSDKMTKHKDLILRERQKDGRLETNEVLKIAPFQQEFVYDITTETGHFHSQGLIQHNCFNYSSFDTALLGIPSEFDGRGGSKPPKNLMSFFGQQELFSLIAGNSTVGATGLADFLIVSSIYMDKILQTGKDGHFSLDCVEQSIPDKNAWQYFESLLTGFIYRLNQPYRGSQSLFSNVSVYDKGFLNNMLDNYKLEIDGNLYEAKLEIVEKIQDIYLNIMNNEMERKPLTFPVTTACFSIDEDNNILDLEFADYIAKQNLKFGFINIYSGESSTLSSCCFDGNQKILTKSSNGVELNTFFELLSQPWDVNRKNFTVYHNGSWCSAKTVKIPVNNKKMFKITTMNNKELLVTDDHIHVTDSGDKNTSSLTTNDYLAFSNRKLDSYPEKCQKLTYEQGFLLGLYLGDGSKYKRTNCESYEITFSLNKSNIIDLDTIKTALVQWGIEKELHIHWQNNTMLTKIYSKELFDIIEEYIVGNYAFEKTINMNILLQSIDFRRGICFGWYASDGENSNRIYTTSKELIPQAEALFNSIGINTVIDISDRTGDDKVAIRGEKFNRNYPLYCIRWYDMKNKRSMGNVYKIINNTEYFKIKSIEEYSINDGFVYCFEMKNKNEQYFTLPNGIITHNCRLRSESDNEYFNSFGSGSTKIGSLGVCTGNLPQLAFTIKNRLSGTGLDGDLETYKSDFLTELKQLVIDCQEVNNAKRNIVNRTIKTGAHPLYSLGYMDIKKQYSTFGVVGLYECLEILGLDIMTENGQEFVLEILKVINEINNELQKRFKNPHNCEQIPAENVAVKLANKDREMGINNDYTLYSNQFIPLVKRVNMLDRISLQGKFDKHFSGGAIAHINMDQEITDAEYMKNLIVSCAKKGIVYFAINYILQECENGHMSVGNIDTCPICSGKITGKYSRVVGFLSKISNWIKERRELDMPNRQFYTNGEL